MTITEIPELKNELTSIEQAAELTPGALYAFKFKGRISEKQVETLRLYLDRAGIHAIVVDESVEAIYKIDRANDGTSPTA